MLTNQDALAELTAHAPCCAPAVTEDAGRDASARGAAEAAPTDPAGSASTRTASQTERRP